MQSDQILTEIHQIREDYAKSFNYDLHSICEDLRKHQAELVKQGWQLVSEPVESPATQPLEKSGLDLSNDHSEFSPLIKLSADVAKFFPDAESVNQALRFLIRISQEKPNTPT